MFLYLFIYKQFFDVLMQQVLTAVCVVGAVVGAIIGVRRAFSSHRNPCEGCPGCRLKESKCDGKK